MEASTYLVANCALVGLLPAGKEVSQTETATPGETTLTELDPFTEGAEKVDVQNDVVTLPFALATPSMSIPRPELAVLSLNLQR